MLTTQVNSGGLAVWKFGNFPVCSMTLLLKDGLVQAASSDYQVPVFVEAGRLDNAGGKKKKADRRWGENDKTTVNLM